MALLDAANRARVAAQWMRELTSSLGCTKQGVRAAVDAVDQWVEDNTAAYNSALPTEFRTSATAAQKALLLCYVAMRRVGKLKAEEDG